MSHDSQKILSLSHQLDTLAHAELVAVAKKKEKKKLDPKAKVRNRGTVCVPAASAKDKKDHFPINSESQARNALARVHQYSSVPPWYSGSLKGLQDAVSRKVHSKYPGIGKADKKKKSAAIMEVGKKTINKYAQMPHQDPNAQWAQEALQQPPQHKTLVEQPESRHLTREEWDASVPPAQRQYLHPQADPQVSKIQTALNGLGLRGADGKPLVVDGRKGKNTNFAIQSFKTENNMPQATDAVALYYILNPSQRASQARYSTPGTAPTTTAASLSNLFNKYGQGSPVSTTKPDPTTQLNIALAPYGYSVLPGSKVEALPDAQYVDVRIQAGPNAQWKDTGHQAPELKKIIDPITTHTFGLASQPMVYSSATVAMYNKYAQAVPTAVAPTGDLTAQVNQALMPYGYSVLQGTKAEPLQGQYVDVKIKAGNGAQFKGHGLAEKDQVKKIIDSITVPSVGLASNPVVYT